MKSTLHAVPLLRFAWLNILAHKFRSLTVVAILFGTALLLVLGLAFMESMEQAMAENLTSAVTGHLHIYSADAHDSLSIFDRTGGNDIGAMREFPRVKAALQAVDGVEAVVPMGTGSAGLSLPHALDRCLAPFHASAEADKPALVD